MKKENKYWFFKFRSSDFFTSGVPKRTTTCVIGAESPIEAHKKAVEESEKIDMVVSEMHPV